MSQQEQRSELFTLLNRAGPMTVEQLGRHPGPDERRIYAIRSFNPMQPTTTVWHLEHHDSKRVLRKWLAENRETLRKKDVSQRSLTYTLSEPMDEAWDVVRDEYDWLDTAEQTGGVEGQSQQEVECPHCEEPVKNLPNHLPCDG